MLNFSVFVQLLGTDMCCMRTAVLTLRFLLPPVCGVYVLDSLPVRQRTGLPQTTGQLHPSVAQPRHGESVFPDLTRL